MREPNILSDYITQRYGSIRTGAQAWGVPECTLYRNCRKPTGAWRFIVQIIKPVLEELAEVKNKMAYYQNEYERLAREYNKLVDQLNGKREMF